MKAFISLIFFIINILMSIISFSLVGFGIIFWFFALAFLVLAIAGGFLL